jgi:hypothetical protein
MKHKTKKINTLGTQPNNTPVPKTHTHTSTIFYQGPTSKQAQFNPKTIFTNKRPILENQLFFPGVPEENHALLPFLHHLPASFP